MNIISIRIADRLPKVESVSATAVSDNEFRFVFAFDDAWKADELKTIWIVYESGEYEAHPVTGCELDVTLQGEPYINIGVSQGTKLASRPCRISIHGSIKQLFEETAQMPSQDQWDTIIEMINQFPGALEAASRAEKAAGDAAETLKAVNTAGETQVESVNTAGSAAIEEVYAAAELKKTEISGIGTVLVGEQILSAAQQARVKSNLDAADGIVETAAGEVIVLDDASDQHLQGMKVYGKSTQDGEPSPDAPVPIVSVGDDGTVNCGVYGKNLLNLLEKPEVHNYSYRCDIDTGAYIAKDVGAYTANRYRVKLPRKGGTYTLSAESISANTRVQMSGYLPGTADINASISPSDLTKTVSVGSNYDELTVTVYCSEKTDIAIYGLMLRLEDTTADFKPYTAQTLPIAVPDGLCGIPVSSGGNYTDADGQMWICDEVDFARGVYVKRTETQDYTDAKSCYVENFTSNVSNVQFNEGVTYSGKKYQTRCYCTHNVYNVNAVSAQVGCRIYNSDTLVMVVSRDFLESLGATAGDSNSYRSTYIAWVKGLADAGTPIKFLFGLGEPIETPLTAEELAAYKALHTNKPNTTIYADENAGLAVDYAADTKTYIDKKFDALAAAIINN